jgi:hypothetical protein
MTVHKELAMGVCGGLGQLVSECPLESQTVEGADNCILSRKRKSHFKTHKILEKNKKWQ